MGSLNRGLKKTKWLGFSNVCVDLGGGVGGRVHMEFMRW